MGTVFDILRCSVNDGPGLRTVVFFKGCPLRCLWCHNPESQNREPELMFNYEKCTACGKCAEICACHTFREGVHEIRRESCMACGKCAQACPADALEIRGRECSADEVLHEVKKDRKFYEKSGGGITISGGEPFQQPVFLKEILQKCRAEGIHTAVETSGCTSADILAQIIPLTDLFLWDYKATKDSVYFTGADRELLLGNLHFALERGARIRLRCPIIPGVGDNDGHLAAIARLAAECSLEGVDILPYHNMGVFKSRQLGRAPWDADFSNMTEEKKEWISQKLLRYGCSGFRIL